MFDVLVVGGGPAGITSAIYAKRAGRNVAIIEKIALGGQLNIIGKIENYPGFSEILGPDLSDEFSRNIEHLDVPVIYDEITDFDFSGEDMVVKGRNGQYTAYSVILALGSNYREIGIEGEKKFTGSGVSYCAVCDGRFFKDKTVAVVGSGDEAITDAIYLSPLVKAVHIFSKDKLKMNNYTFLDLEKRENVFVHENAVAKKIDGNNVVESLEFENGAKKEKMPLDAVFVAVGRKPATEMLKGKLELNDKGYIKINEKMQTSEQGVYACGDITDPLVRQISVAVGQGAIAGTEASKFALKKLFEKKPS